MRSLGPPAANGTTTRTGLEGYSWASAAQAIRQALTAARIFVIVFRGRRRRHETPGLDAADSTRRGRSDRARARRPQRNADARPADLRAVLRCLPPSALARREDLRSDAQQDRDRRQR